MRRIHVIGAGLGAPEHLTLQAIAALREASVIFMIDKVGEVKDLQRARLGVCEAHCRGGDYRVVEIPEPPRDRAPLDYVGEVERWHGMRADVFRKAILTELPDDGVGAILVWGDPSIYDGAIRALQRAAEGAFDFDVTPGISSAQMLAARHRVTLNTIGGSVMITTGRRMSAGWPAGADTIVVMLDAQDSFMSLDDETELYWGAYLGSRDEILIAGRAGDVKRRIRDARAAARKSRGWIMDIYLARRASAPFLHAMSETSHG